MVDRIIFFQADRSETVGTPRPILIQEEEVDATRDIKMTMSGDIKAAFDFGFIKGGYERKAATDSHTYTIGSGVLEASYEYGRLGPGREHRLNVTMSTNFLKIVPGGDLAGQFLSIGSKHSIQWGSRSGYRSSTRVEGKTKIGFSVT